MQLFFVLCIAFIAFNPCTAEARMLNLGTRQPWPVSEQCPTGSPEAERLFQLGVDYHQARNDKPWDLEQAELLYEQALALGNAKAAINLGILYRLDYNLRPQRAERHKYMLTLYQKAVDMGCPEGLTLLAEAYGEGWGVSQSASKAEKLIREAAEKGSLMSMTNLGVNLYHDGELSEGKEWLKKALKAGCGNAGAELSMLYTYEKDAENTIHYLREGAKLGSMQCLHLLAIIYAGGRVGQPADMEYAEKIGAVVGSIDDKAPPKPIPNFDELVPPRPVLPFKEWD